MKIFPSTTEEIKKEKKIKFTLRRERLNQGGYDRTGCYWGSGNLPLYFAQSEKEFLFYGPHPQSLEGHFRAVNREHAKELIRKEIPNAVFYK